MTRMEAAADLLLLTFLGTDQIRVTLRAVVGERGWEREDEKEI